MAGKKATFTCKICGQEHAGLICTKFSSVRVLGGRQQGRTEAVRQLTGPEKPIDRVSTPALPEIDGEATDVTEAIVTPAKKPVTIASAASKRGGRAKVHGSPAAKQAAYRARKKAK